MSSNLLFHGLAIATLMLAASACSDEKAATGDACSAASDCADDRCIEGGSFPAGVCTPTCAETADCPDGFSCISRSSGMCLRNCADAAQCEDARGTGWQCRPESLQGDGGGNVDVCIGA